MFRQWDISVDLQIDHFLKSYTPQPPLATCDKALNALLREFDQAAATNHDTIGPLIVLSDRVARMDLALFSQRGKFIDRLNPLYDAYLKLVDATMEAHAACARYLFLRRKMAPAALSRCMKELCEAAEELETQWKATTAALRVAVESYCVPPSVVSIIQWIDWRNAARSDLPDLLDAIPEALRMSTEALEDLVSAYKKLEDALLEVERIRQTSFASEHDFGIALMGLFQLDTAILRYRAGLLVANRWTLDRGIYTNTRLTSSPLRALVYRLEGDFLVKYCGVRTPRWLLDYHIGM
ncbi:hypothetical protein FB45DRAFT_942300 [Roridomyces roridus]|uniref:Uncharacterized protein n=1 Tax=Roridomyces roridus TaxID=1738132 RepID=A0AAD7B606_9AGAR|nr:hypothetical protein FB45DRAFT_942300 [Roridomyces roridus]